MWCTGVYFDVVCFLRYLAEAFMEVDSILQNLSSFFHIYTEKNTWTTNVLFLSDDILFLEHSLWRQAWWCTTWTLHYHIWVTPWFQSLKCSFMLCKEICFRVCRCVSERNACQVNCQTAKYWLFLLRRKVILWIVVPLTVDVKKGKKAYGAEMSSVLETENFKNLFWCNVAAICQNNGQ